MSDILSRVHPNAHGLDEPNSWYTVRAMERSRRLLQWSLCWTILVITFPVFGGPLDSWTIVPSGTTNHLRAVAFGGGVFVAAGDFGTVLTSSNGVVWTAVALGIMDSLRGV